MSSFRTTLSPSEKAAARFVDRVRRTIQKALFEENRKRGLTQSDIARDIGVHRSVINREIQGYKDITLGRVAELALALGRVPKFDLLEPTVRAGSNLPPHQIAAKVDTSAAAREAVVQGQRPLTARAA